MLADNALPRAGRHPHPGTEGKKPNTIALAGPEHSWELCRPETLDAILAAEPWSLVEFWTPSCLFSRLLAPVRTGIAASHGGRVRLLCCCDQNFGAEFIRFGAIAMPAVLLFRRDRRTWRWLGATDVSLLRFELNHAMAATEEGDGDGA